MSKKNIAKGIAGFLCVVMVTLILSFASGMIDLGFKSFFKPRYANIERETFKHSKSYVEGKITDLAKYYEEYMYASEEDKLTIKNLVRMNFSNFDKSHIDSYQLQAFLESARGY